LLKALTMTEPGILDDIRPWHQDIRADRRMMAANDNLRASSAPMKLSLILITLPAFLLALIVAWVASGIW